MVDQVTKQAILNEYRRYFVFCLNEYLSLRFDLPVLVIQTKPRLSYGYPESSILVDFHPTAAIPLQAFEIIPKQELEDLLDSLLPKEEFQWERIPDNYFTLVRRKTKKEKKVKKKTCVIQ